MAELAMHCYCSPPKQLVGFYFSFILYFLNMKPLSEVSPGLLDIQIQIQAVCSVYNVHNLLSRTGAHEVCSDENPSIAHLDSFILLVAS